MTSRFRALNVDLSDESDNDTEATSAPTKEALEEKATALYMGALELQGNEKWEEAEELYRLLLNSVLLSDVSGKVQFINGRIKPSLEHLKYSVYQNLGHVLVAKKQLQEGLDFYKKALEIDDTDLNLWYKIGLTGMKLVDLNLAISAFQAVLEMNPRHFPSLDNIITATYAQGGLLMCLHYIARALQYNHKYKKGLALKDRIFKDHPSMKEHYVVFDPYPDYKFSTSEEEGLDAVAAESWHREVVELRVAEAEQAAREREKQRETADFTIPCRPTTWLQLSLVILTTHLQFTDEAPELDFFRPVKLLTDVPFSEEDMQLVKGSEQGMADENLDHKQGDGAHDNEDVEPCGVRGKRRRSSPTPMEQLGATKRRSTRARNTARKEEPTLARTLTTLLPTTLLLEGKEENEVVHLNDDSMDTMDMYQLFANKDSGEVQELELLNNLSENERNKIIQKEGYFNTEKETEDINKFLEKNNEMDILTLLDQVILELAEKWDKHWPNLLPATYVTLYSTYLKHNPPVTSIPSLLKSETEGLACVLFGELLLDQWLLHGKSRNALPPLAGSCFGGDFPSLLLGDLFDLSAQTSNSEFFVRIFWMHALFNFYNEEVATAINKLSIIQESEHLRKVDIHLVNVTHHFIVRKSTVEGMLSTLNRKQMVDELTELYQQDDCEQIVSILTEVLKPSKFGSSLLQSALERDAQYSLLLYTLWRLDKYNECLQWSEMFVHESVTQLLAAVAEDNEELKLKWISIVHNTILCILTCLNYCGNQILDSLEKNKLSRLVQSLRHVICRQIEIGQVPESEFDIISPWMLLYEIITHCEKDTDIASSGTAEERLPSSIRLLFTAHEYLGRREWCCFDEGVILYQTLYQLQTLMDLYHPESEEYSVLSQQLEQILYCLYGHPMKQKKPRYVQEHNMNGLELTWARSHQVLSLLRPKELPTFDSSSKCSITADTEALFRRIIQLVPQENKPDNFVEEMTSYIEGNVDIIPQNDNPLPTEMADIYYLIADHYFKNKTWSKALKFYILDVCNNSERVDSWACLALARGSMLETKLNSCDPLKSKSDFLKKAMMSCRCYKTSLDLDSALPTLWIEYGSFSYMVHSFCSRLLKQDQNLSLEMFDSLETQKESMIQKSLSCFTFANKLWYTEDGQEMQDERWLHHYMLGKISEKKQDPLSQCISHYLKSMEFLHLNNAMYPSLVTYNTPQYLAVEALELYYRVHAVILKTLEQSEDRPVDPETRKLFKDTLDKLSSGPFAQKVTRNEESEGLNPAKQTVYIDSEETRMATVKRLMDSVLKQVEEDVYVEQSKKTSGGKGVVSADSGVVQPAKRVKREDSETSSERKAGKSVRTSTESSSDSDSDTDSSSESSGSSSDDSDATSEEEKSKTKKEDKSQSEESDENWKREQEALIARCLEAFEDCAQRFPEHYKSLYRLAHFYFRSKSSCNVDKARQLLLGESGLFANRKASNFFNGVWRIPSTEIDRPGSFASHMSRCVLLLVDILRHTRDHKLLFDLALQLRDTPDSDKKYLRDPEREELSAEALSLSVQALRCKVSEAKTAEEQKTVVLEAYKVYKSCNKLWEHKVLQFSTLLTDAYTQFRKEEGSKGDLVDAAVRFCTQELATQKAAVSVSAPSSASHSAFSSPDVSQTPSPVQMVPPIPVQQRPPLKAAPPVKRGRGRPPNSSIRHQNPNSMKASQQKTSAEDLAQMYRNLIALQMLNQGKSQESLNQAVINQALMNPALTQQMMQFTQQMNFHNDYIRKQVLIQQQFQNMKDSKVNPSVLPPQQKNETPSSKSMNTLLAPSKVSVFSSQSVLPPGNPSKLPLKPQSSLSISPIPSNTSNSVSIFQQGAQAHFSQAKNVTTSKQTPPKASPFQQKISTDPKVSLQHKLLTAKTSKSQISSVSITPSMNKSKLPKDNKASTSLSAASLTSRGVSITASKPPEIKIPKDITIGQGLSISPVSAMSPKTKSALSPSTKEVTLTILKTQSEVKVVKPGSSLSVTLKDSKKQPPNSGTGKERNSPTPTIRMGSGVTIIPAKSNKQPLAKPIPKADFSITLAKGDEKKKKEESSEKVIVID